ncbi:MAG: DNA polymerase II large subunit, partial [Candidatus Altiarchaeales archaeon HGW-Altiarchaeales-1]
EVILYDRRCKPLQYCPTEDEIRTIVRKVPVCVDGDPTEDVEVMAHRDIKRIPTNNIRGGACLVIGEGLALKAKKLAKKAKDFNINWDFLLSVGKKKAESEGAQDSASFMSEIVGGRPIFSFSNTSGGFRLRYGRSRASGIAGKSIHPATMLVLDDFIATGTQIKMDRPGKGAVITSCDSIEGPIVKLKNGNVMKLKNLEITRAVKKDIEEILFLGDLLVSFGDFLQTNTPLLPSGYVEEWYQKDLKKVGIEKSLCEINAMSAAEAVEIAEKRTLEILGNEHTVENGFIVISDYVSLLFPLGMLEYDSNKKFKFNPQVNFTSLRSEIFGASPKIAEQKPENNENYDASLPLVNKFSKVMIRKKAGTYIGTRMGRPEKAKERKMQPPVHCLFPIGKKGGRERLINEAIKHNYINIEISDGMQARKGEFNVKEMWDKALKNLNLAAPNVKCVEGLISAEKVPEKIEKGILRAKNDVFVFKDGTIRYDMTDVPLTHFKPKEIFTSVEKLKMLGYDKDYKNNPLVSNEQILELKCQDIIVPKESTDYLIKVAKFVDDELCLYYKMPPYYNIQKTEDLIGIIIVGLAPHTSAGIIGRIIGFCDATCCFAHPLWHTAKRRNTDGDEDAIMLLLETLLNFSKKFLPASRGGRMDAPLVVTMTLDANEVDDESHKVEVVESYPDDFYEYTLKSANPSEVKVKNIGDLLITNPYENLNFTNDNGNLSDGVARTKYVILKDMSDFEGHSGKFKVVRLANNKMREM